MIQSFADRTTADLWAQLNTKAARRIPRALWPVVHRKLTMLDGAQRLEIWQPCRAIVSRPSPEIEKANTVSA